MAQQHLRKSPNSLGAPFFTEDPAAAYKHFLPRVAMIPADRVETCRAEPAQVRANVQRSIDAITPHLSRVREELPKIPVKELLELPGLALALVFAAGRVTGQVSTKEIATRLSKLRKLRSLMLDQLEILAALGFVSSEIVAAIRRGNGPLDSARDGVAIASLFQERREMIAGKHPFTDEHISEIADHGKWLVDHLTPAGTRPAPASQDSATLIRDRFWTALLEGYPSLRKVGVYLFGEDGVDARMPALATRSGAARSSSSLAKAASSKASPSTSRSPTTGRGPSTNKSTKGPPTARVTAS